MKTIKKRVLTDILFVAAAIAIVLTVWYVASVAVDSEFIVPSPGAAFRAFGIVFETEEFWSGLGGTGIRCVIGFAAAFVLFIVTFYFSVSFYTFGRIIEPILSAIRSLPAVAVTLILILSAGPDGAPVILGVTVIYPIMYSSAKSRISSAPTELKEICRLCGATKWQTFRVLWFPYLAGGLAENIASAFSYNVKAVIGAEILAQTASSLGMLMKLSQIYLQPEMLVAYVICAVVFAAVAELLLRAVLGVVLKKFVA